MDLKIEKGRHIILGSFVGILTVQGVIISTSVFGDTSIIIYAAFGGAVALALANYAGSYMWKSAKEYDKLSRLEKPLLRSLDDTKIKKLTEKKIQISSLVMSGSSFIGSMIPILPFIFFESHYLEVSIGSSITALALLGIYWGKVLKQNILLYLIKMTGLGGVIILGIYILFQIITGQPVL
jgi:predicted membrane protein (TIGR00267 family)